jgi:hypothetical protein
MLTLVIKNIKNEPSSGGTPDSYMLTPVIKNIKNEPSLKLHLEMPCRFFFLCL